MRLALFLIAIPLLAQQIDYPTQVRRTPALDSRAYVWSRTNGLGASGNLSTAGAGKTIQLVPCPKGIPDYIYISEGTGTAEAVPVTGGTCTAGSTGGTLTVTTSNTHTGAWVASTAWGGVSEALNAGGPNVTVDLGSSQIAMYTPLAILQDNVTLRCNGCKVTGEPPNGSSHIVIAGVSNTTIEGLWLHNPHASTAQAYNLIFVGQNAVNTNIQNNKLTGLAPTNAVQANALGIVGLHVRNNLISGLNFGGLVNSVATDIIDFEFSGNRVTGIYGDGVELNVYTAASYPSARNFRIVNNYFGDFAGDNTDPATGFCVGISGPSNVLVEGNQMGGCRIQGVHIESGAMQAQGARYVVVSGNVISSIQSGIPSLNTGIWAFNCIYCDISNNIVTGAVGWAIELAYDGTEESHNLTISGNIGRGNGSSTTGCINASSSPTGAANWILSKNNCSENTGDGLRITGDPIGVQVEGNIATGNTRFGLHVVGVPALFTSKNNDFHGNGIAPTNISGTVGAPIQIQDSKNINTLVSVGGTATSNPFDCVSLGRFASGLLTVRASNNLLSDTQFATSLWNVSWNGSALSGGTAIGLAASGALTSIDLLMPSLTVTDATNANPIVLTFSASHFLTDGTILDVASVGGNTNANGSYYTKSTASNKVALYTNPDLTTGRAGNSAYTSGGTAKSETLQCTVTQFGGSSATITADIQFTGTVVTNGIGQ